MVHFSVTNPSNDYDLPYFRGKAQVEEILKGLGVTVAIIRPTLVYGDGDLLLNNMAWCCAAFPFTAAELMAGLLTSEAAPTSTIRLRRLARRQRG